MKREQGGGGLTDPGGPGIPGGTPIRRDVKNPTQLGKDPRGGPTPFLDPRVSDPAAVAYAVGAEGRRRGSPPVPKFTEPNLAGGPDLPIPRLDSEPQPGLTMAQQGAAERRMPVPNIDSVIAGMGGEPALRRDAPSPGIVEGVQHQQPAPPAQRGLGQLPPGIRAGDMLPEQAQRDPAFQTGQGAMFAVNQPHLAYKYGVQRGPQFVSPAVLKNAQTAASGAKPSLRPETLEGLEALDNFNKERTGVESGNAAEDRKIEEEARTGPARGAGATAKPMSEREKKDLLADMDDFDLSRFKNALFKDLLNNDEQREIIEARLRPLDLTELIMHGRVTQVVPVQPGIFEPEFQSYGADEDLTIKRLISEEAKGLDLSDRYLLDKYTLMGLTIAVKAINKTQLIDYRMNGQFSSESSEAFWKKFSIVSRFNYHMISSLAVNWFWFDMRVRRLFKAETLGNG